MPSGTGSHLDEMPLVAMPVEQAVAIVHCAFVRHLAADGVFYPFTYVPRCPIPARYLRNNFV